MSQGPTADQLSTLSIFNNVTSSLSLIGSMWIICAYLKAPRFWSITGRMVICLAFSDLLYTISNLLSNVKDKDPLCKLSGFFRTFGSLASFLWGVKIARMAFEIFRGREEEIKVRHYSWFNLFKSFIFPAVFAFIPLFNLSFLSYGSIGADCGIRSNVVWIEKLFYFVLLFLPMIICLITIIFYYGRLLALSSASAYDHKIEKRRLFWYPLGLIIAWIPALVYGLVIQTYKYVYILDSLRVLFAHSSGIINAGIYVMTKDTVSTTVELESESVDSDYTTSLNSNDSPHKL